MAKPMGRPTSYKPEYCEQIIDHMKDGKSIVSFAVEIDVCRDTVFEWAKVHPDFSVALKKASHASQKHWEDLLARGTAGEIKGFNVVGCIFAMKNRFAIDWREKQEVQHSGKLTLEDLVSNSLSSKDEA